MDLVNSVL
jgi:hypothetical protein